MPDENDSKVTLRNTMRRPLTFRVAGKTVRLSPGEDMQVPASWLGSAEVQHLRGAGLVSMEAAREPVGEGAGEGEEEGEGEGDDDEGDSEPAPKRPKAKRRTPHKRKPTNPGN